jgi:class 3 adenylate cyclase/tetratricopeptide (TPR) repeat protein
VSVLFVDLVGFTTASEGRDAEDTRELLSRYFDLARTTVERYGGTVEKFIGDAVMAVWGAPVANEDDAERAVRAALDLVAAVPDLDPALRARAGVLTGEAAVTVGADAQGMVAGDLVNTASRIQAAAEPGSVLVGDRTRHATEASIAYDHSGAHTLKGKVEPVPLWRARQVTAGRKGAQKSIGLEAPFVGREREFRLLKDLFHATAEEGRTRLVSVVGVAGIGKSRLGWEFFKYIDGLAEDIWWHRGRCLAYGEGVAYWALAEMVRGRAGILENDDSETAVVKLHAAVEEHVADPEERAWIEPRLAHLLALEDRSTWSREDLFSAWRVFFERLAEQGPCVLVFEDLHWADSGLLDFVEHVLEWSRAQPLYVLTLARPELADRRPDWGAGKRNFTSLYLEPLAEGAMDELLRGLAPGLPDELLARIRARADGVPLYAVETVRMLVDRGLLERADDEYRVAGPVDRLDVPETLHALVAARLDGLPPDERRLLDDASVLGKTFSARALAEITGRDEAEVEPLLASLVRREVLGVQSDPRSPERGQYGFLQALAQRVAYETLSRSERKTRHLAVAEHLENAWGADDDEVVEVIASHLLDAYRANPDAADADILRRRAYVRLSAAGDRAVSLGARAEAESYYRRAAELVDGRERADVLERAGWAAWLAARGTPARELLSEAVAAYEAAGDERSAAAASGRLGEVDWAQGRSEAARDRLERAFEVLAAHEPDERFARVAAEAGRVAFFAGDLQAAGDRLEHALAAAERLRVPDVISHALNTKALVIGRWEESLALMRHALTIAVEHDLVHAAGRAYFNLGFLLQVCDRYDEARRTMEDGVRFAARRGDQGSERLLQNALVGLYAITGEWNEAVDLRRSLEEDAEAHDLGYLMEIPIELVQLFIARGEREQAARAADALAAEDDSDVQARIITLLTRALLESGDGHHGRAVEHAAEAHRLMLRSPFVAGGADALIVLVEASVALADLGPAQAAIDELASRPPGERTQSLDAHEARLRALVERARGETEHIDGRLRRAAALFREVGMPFWLAVTMLEHGEWLAAEGQGEEAEPLVREAREIFERLRAQPWLERADALAVGDAVASV